MNTHTERHISAVILAKFSNIWFGYVAAPSFWFLFSSLSYFGKKKKQQHPNLLLLSLDNGGLCICCICIHKIKMKAEIFPVWDCYLVSGCCILYGCCCQFRKMVLINLFENKAKPKSHYTLNLERRYVQK